MPVNEDSATCTATDSRLARQANGGRQLRSMTVQSLLARYIPVETLRGMKKGKYGKPYISEPGFHFNVSHCGGHLVVATSSHPVGVDIEYVQPARAAHEGLCKRVFHPREAEVFRRLDALERPLFFFRVWTRKEAYFKWLGVGLSGDFPGWDSDVGASTSVRSSSEAYCLRDIAGGPPLSGHIGCLCYENAAAPSDATVVVQRINAATELLAVGGAHADGSA